MIRRFEVDGELCGRCGRGPAVPIALVGEYHTLLCVTCTDDWGIYCKADPMFQQLRENDEERNVRQMEIAFKGDYDQRRSMLAALRNQGDELRKQLRDKARLWVMKCNVPTQ